MFRLINWSIKTKLRVFSAVSVAFALLFSAVSFLVRDADSIRATKARQLVTLAEVLATHTLPDLESHDSEGANRSLAAPYLQPTVQMAVLYDAYGVPLATHPEGIAKNNVMLYSVPTRGTVFSPGFLEHTQDIFSQGHVVGTIHLRTTLDELNHQFLHYLRIVVGVMIAALLTAVLIADQLQRILTGPIHELVTAMRRVSTDGDYTLRVRRRTGDELGILCDGFNTMLGQIQHGRNSLQVARDELELRVEQRTAELYGANEELSAASAAARAANETKSAFLANMSHEIRTPMTAIQGFADLLLDPVQSAEDRQEYVQTIRKNSRHLLALINDILDLSKIEAGKMAVECLACSPAQIVKEVCALMRVRACEKKLTLSVRYATPIPETIHTDPTRLRQILTNLVGNAIKFTHCGGVQLVLSLIEIRDRESPSFRMSFDVIDTGVGVTADQMGRIFEPFTQADASTVRRFGGTGLGLAISRRFAEMLGGNITVTSEPRRGSRFCVTIETGDIAGVRRLNGTCLTIQNAEDELRASADSTGAAASVTLSLRLTARVLIVEDGIDNQRLIAHLLRKSGAEVVLADNGQTGLEIALEEHAADRPFDVILMDMQMPVLDGYVAASRLRAANYRGPIIALTAHAMSHDRQKCLDAGCNDYMTKPIDRHELIAKVAQWAAGPSELAATADASAAPQLK